VKYTTVIGLLTLLSISACENKTTPAPAKSSATAEATAPPRSGHSADGTYEVRWEPVGGLIPDADPFAIDILVVRTDGAALDATCVVRVDAEMPQHGHGMNLVPTVKRGETPAAFRADGLLFHMSGRWMLAIDVDESGVAERTQWFIDVD
jgi:hypothetical protein